MAGVYLRTVLAGGGGISRCQALNDAFGDSAGFLIIN